MPEELERKLKAEARKKGFTGDRARRYVYGTMRKTGWKPSTQKKKRRGKRRKKGRRTS
jgi:hypothetical protein